MVILFGLLFAPMISGLNLVQRGKRHVALQDAVRLALETMKRELADAVYVFQPDVILTAGPDGSIGTADDVPVVDYSVLTFLPAARDASGLLVQPVQPETITINDPTYGAVTCFKAVRYVVHLAEPTQPHGEDNPFVLFRQEGCAWQPPGSGGAWQWWDAHVLSENALTPRSGADLVPLVSICQACGTVWNGYTAVCLNPSCPSYNTAADMRHIAGGVQFVPQRVSGEVLRVSEDGALYRAKWRGWLGSNKQSATAPWPPPTSELDSRLVIWRYDPGTSDWTTMVADTADPPSLPPPEDLPMNWDCSAGAVRFGQWYSTGAQFNLLVAPAPFYSISIDVDATDGRGPDVYDTNGVLVSGAAYTQDLYPVYPPQPQEPQDPVVPIAYVIDPTWHGARPPAKILPDMVSVRLLVGFAGGAYRYYALQRTSNYDQDRIGRWQFCALASSDLQSVQVRFSRTDPPSPDWFGGPGSVTSFGIEVRYYARHNFDPVSGQDDIVVADYSTRYIMNLCLNLATYVDLEPSSADPNVLVVPADIRPHHVQGRDQVVIRNAMD